MNNITAMGGTAFQRDLAQSVVSFCIKTLLPNYRTLDITVAFKNLQKSEGAYGFCNTADYHTTNREFILDIDRDLRLYDMVSTICHEMVHVKQYVKKELSDLYDESGTKWKKKKYSMEYDYHNSPWEKEAYKLEESLAIKCFKEVL
jgi:hypothetical protein